VDLTAAYGRFRDEAADVSAGYTPETVNTDGWKATQAAWRTLFPRNAVIWCLLHRVLWIRDRGRQAVELPLFPKIAVIWCLLHRVLWIRDRGRQAVELHRKAWEVDRATRAQAFREAMEPFRQWCVARVWPGPSHEAWETL
jgi:hypothetical protein